MLKHNPGNERNKRIYFTYLKEAKRQSEQSVDAVAKALARFEEYTHFKDFKAFHHQQAIAFKNHLAKQKGQRSGELLSKATLHSTLSALQRSFCGLPGSPVTNQCSRIPMLIISACRAMMCASQRLNGNKDHRPWNK